MPPRAPFVDHNEGAGGTKKWIFWYDDSGHRLPEDPALRFHINSSTLGALDPVVSPWNPNTGRWYHVAITRSGSNYSLYIDGAHVITEVDFNTIPDAETPLFIGQSELNYFFNGLIDEVEIFNRALSASEIQALYDAGSAGKCKDDDYDGVEDAVDLCPGTIIPEATVPSSGNLNPNHWALLDVDTIFDTVKKGKGGGSGRSFTTTDTGGCSCEQIIVGLGLGNGHVKHGCSNSAMDEWVAIVAGTPKRGADTAEIAAEVPEGYVLEANYPNPFNPSTEIRFQLPEAVHVRLIVYDVMGRELVRLVDGAMPAGQHHATWDASGLPSGVYLYRLTADVFTETKAMTLQK